MLLNSDEALARQLQAEENIHHAREQEELQRHLATQRGGHSARQHSHFESQLRAGVAQVQQYEDGLLQALALSALPEAIVELTGGPASQHDELARQLLAWFKKDFFTWVNNPPCANCGHAETALTGRAHAETAEEMEGHAQIVETYCCSACSHVTRFPRYNHPGKLLETRRGRCGEWANAFTLICRAAGLEVRWVRDWTDHVWTEFYSDNEQRWIHLDPCENAFDQPQLYEGGWGKKLNYAIAFSRLGTADVSARYSADRAGMLERQRKVTEPEWVKATCRGLTYRQRNGLEVREAAVWEMRDRQEQMELHNPTAAPLPSQEGTPLPGRQTGSVQWRAARGELGKSPAAPPAHPERQAEVPASAVLLSAAQPDSTPMASQPPTPAAPVKAEATVQQTRNLEQLDALKLDQSAAGQRGTSLPVKETTEVGIAPAVSANAVAPSAGPKEAGHMLRGQAKPMSKDDFTKQMQELFAGLVAEGKSPNEAAILALQQLRG